MTTELRVSIRNESDIGGTALTPFFTGFHNGSFDVYDLGGAASAGLEALAEDGNNSVIAGELLAADADGQTTNVAGERGPIDTRELASSTISVNGVSNGYLGLASMILPSNDAFIGTANAVQLFDDSGQFLGAQTISFGGSDVRDAGTEVNTEVDAAFINQTGPNTGIDEGGVVTTHAGFNGSEGNPGGEQIILGGTNAFGNFIDPSAADFTVEGAQVATVHVNTVARQSGSDYRDFLWGGRDDDFIDGGAGNDIISGGRGWDVLNGEDGRDFIFGGSGDDIINGGADRDFLKGGSGNDDISGGSGNDTVWGASGNDNISGDEGKDLIFGGSGNDLIDSGAGRDNVYGGRGDDVFIFAQGNETDIIRDFDRQGDDRIAITVDGFEAFGDVVDAAYDTRWGVEIDFGAEDTLILRGVEVSDLSSNDFLFI
ncbi:MAG: spondin domain-containing protein [Roseobacter sp.]